MSEPFYFTCILSLCLLLIAWLRQLALWQRKEYRFDRLWSAIISPELVSMTAIGLYLFYASIAVSWALYLLNIIAPINVISWTGLIGLAIHFIYDYSRRGFVRPLSTPKLLLVAAASALLILCYLIMVFKVPQYPGLHWGTAIYFLPLFVGVSVALVNIPARIRKRQTIKQAATLRRSLRKLQVIGITGSVGKTSTKEFLRQIMQAHQKAVVATKDHRNSEYTVAVDMRQQLTPRTSLYIAEMGAYRRGEIAALSQLTLPHLGLITAISNQHAALFGSQQAIALTKWELIKALPRDGKAILNADDPILAEFGSSAPCPVTWYSTQKPADVRLSNITYEPDRTNFTLRIAGEQRKITTAIISSGLINSLAAAIAAASALNVSTTQIAAMVRQLKSLPRTMELRTGLSGSVIIDDSYSASEGSIRNAVEHLTRFKQSDKRIAMVPIIELGSLGPAVHKQLGEFLGTIPAEIHIYGHAYKKNIEQGLVDSPKRCTITWYHHPLRFAEAVSQNLSADSALLLEGRLPNVVHKALNLS